MSPVGRLPANLALAPLRPAQGAASRPQPGARQALARSPARASGTPAAARPRPAGPVPLPGSAAASVRAPMLALYEANQAGWPAPGPQRIDLYA